MFLSTNAIGPVPGSAAGNRFKKRQVSGGVVRGTAILVACAMCVLVRPSLAQAPSHTVVFDGTTSPAKTWYTLKASGDITQVGGSLDGHDVTINPNDSVNGSNARGFVGAAKDGYRLNGRIEEISLEDPGAASVYVDGDPFHTVVLDGTVAPGKKSDYTVRVSGRIEQYDGTINGRRVTKNANDNVSGSTARGLVGDANDGFYVYGDIDEIALDNPLAASVYVDGERFTDVLFSGSLANLEFDGCSADTRALVNQAVWWLRADIHEVDDQMGSGGLMDWPGNSRRKFTNKLNKTLKFKCIDHRPACDPLAGRVIPVLHHKRIALCSNHISNLARSTSGEPFHADELAWYIQIVAHEVGHHVRWNVHRTNCRRSFRAPRFSQSVGLAAFHGYLGHDYSSGDWMRWGC